MPTLLTQLKDKVREHANIHRPTDETNIFLFSSPRGGSTWLMELIQTQPGFKSCAEPLNLRNPDVRQHLDLTEWNELYSARAEPALEAYFDGLCRGSLRFMNHNPLKSHYRPVTHRIVFKILHGGEERLTWFAEKFNGQVVLLLRHPLAVSLSRQVYPRLRAFLETDYRRHFSPKQLTYSQKILDSGCDLERGVLSWCLQNAVSLVQAEPDWMIVTYEQLVLDPEPIIRGMSRRLNLPRPELMLERLTVPSGVKAKSDPETQRLLESNREIERQKLVSKWRHKISSAEEERLMAILDVFDLDVYQAGSLLPHERFLIQVE